MRGRPRSKKGVSTEREEGASYKKNPENNKTYSNDYTIMSVHFSSWHFSNLHHTSLTKLYFPFTALSPLTWKGLQSDPDAFPP